MEPVGLMGKQPDFTGTLSNLMSLKQQRQQLQVGAQQVQQGQLETQRQQAIQDFYKDFDPTEITAPDGSLDLHKAFSMPKYKAAGNAKPFIAENLITLRQKGLEATNALANLDHNVVSQFGTGLGAYINDQDVKDDTPTGRAKTAEFIKSFGALDAEHAKIMNMYSLVVDHAPPGKLASSLRVIQQQAQSASEQQAQQNPRTGAIDNGPNVILTNTDVPTGAVSQTGTIAKGTAPTITTNAQGQLVRVEPNAAGASVVGGANPTAAQAAANLGAAQGITERVQHAQAAANGTIQAQDALTRSLAILDNPNIDTGAAFEQMRGLKNIMSSIGIDTESATDANSLVKNLARYEAARATQAGLGGTDAARELAHNGSPNTAVDKTALKGIVKQSLATEKAVAAYARVQAKTTDPAIQQQNESAFQSIPNVVLGYEYGLTKTPQEADEFLKKHGLTKEKMKETRLRIKEFESR